jgi:Bax protein
MFSKKCTTPACLAIVMAVTLISSYASSAEFSFPQLPQQVTSPCVDPEQRLLLQNAKQLHSKFAEFHYSLDDVTKNRIIPTIFTTNLPSDLNQQPVDEKISTFIRLMLPNITAVNKQILLIRKTLKQWVDTPLTSLTDAQQSWLKDLCARYSISTVNVKELLQHIDTIPVGMVLAQAIEESGWGTGHFAIEGNALYGQHLPESGGKFLLTPNGKVKVAAFDTIYQATAAYIYDINSSRAYQDLRVLRYNLKKNNSLSGYALVKAFGHYSVRGQGYVNSLRDLIKNHHLDSFNNAILVSKKIVATIDFEKRSDAN